MTFVIGCIDGADGYLFCDSALSHDGPPQARESSFGELQLLDDRTVEERMLKILDLVPGVSVGIVGYIIPALEFVEVIRTALRVGGGDLPAVLEKHRHVASDGLRFELMFVESKGGRARIIVFVPGRPLGLFEHNGVMTIGSLSYELKSVMVRTITKLRRLAMPPEVRVAATLVGLQMLSVRNVLPQQGVGGAFFGLHIKPNGVAWQPAIEYSVYPPTLPEQPVVQCGEVPPPPPSIVGMRQVHVSVEDGAAFVASLAEGVQHARFMTPALKEISQASGESLFRRQLEGLHASALSARHFGFLGMRDDKAVYVYREDSAKADLVWMAEQDDHAVLRLDMKLAQELSRRPSEGSLELVVIIDRGTGESLHARLDVSLEDEGSEVRVVTL